MKKIMMFTTIVGVLLLLFGVQFVVVNASSCGTSLAACLDVKAHDTLTFHWNIAKSVAPDTLNMFTGDSGTAQYNVTVQKDAGALTGWLDGQVCVVNQSTVATQNMKIVLEVTKPPSTTVLASTNVGLGNYPVVKSYVTRCYKYSVDVPAPTTGATYKITTKVTTSNFPMITYSKQTVMPASPTLVNDTVNVDDTNGMTWAFNASGAQSYPKTFTCNSDQGQHNNTATIRETKQSASASVMVNCSGLQVTKTADTSFTRAYKWVISKTADQTALTLGVGQTFPVNYTVTVGLDPAAPYVDSNYAVAGNIYVKNLASIAATLNGVSDVISGVGAVAPDCGVSFPYTLAAGSTLTCSYSAPLPDAASRTNTATAILQNTPSGTSDYTGTAAVDFSAAAMSELDKCVDVTDTLGGALGQVCADAQPKTFQYTYTVGPYASCGSYTVDNTAAFTAVDTQATGSASWQVAVTVPCQTGCTLTIGYWKTHAGFTGKNPDKVTEHLPIWLGTAGGAKAVEVTSAAQAVDLLSMSDDASNGINKLYAQMLGAKLNIASGASSSAVDSAIADADAFLANYDAVDWTSLSAAEKDQVLGWATTFDDYNNGLIGPGHCE